MCTEIHVLDQFLLNFHVFTTAASHYCTWLQWPVIKFYKPPPKRLLFSFYDSKESSTIATIKEKHNLCLNTINFQCLIRLTRQISVFMGLVTFYIWSWFNTTLLPTCQGKLNLLNIIIFFLQTGWSREIIWLKCKINLVRLVRNSSKDVLGVRVRAHPVDGTIWPMVQTERTTRELFWSSPLS